MDYFAVYWGQVKAVYRTMWNMLCVRHRDLDGGLSDYVMKPGFIWELLELHKQLVTSIWAVMSVVVGVITGYFTLVLVLILVVISPLLILIATPFTLWNIRRDLRKRGEAL